MNRGRLVVRVHAALRMLQRGILLEDVERVLDEGDLVEAYPDDTPFPSRLVLGFVRGLPLHVVAADDPLEGVTYVITAYHPDPARWDADFRRRRP